MWFYLQYFGIFLVYSLSSVFYSIFVHVHYKFDELNDWACHDFEKPVEKLYDYIVVGAGTAGSIVAARLSENPAHSVLLIEAGGRPSPLFSIPITAPMLQLTPYDWQYKTVPQDGACLGLVEKRSVWPRGKILGGSSRLNYMMYLRGHPRDYDSWKSKDCKHWTERDILYYFKRSENQKGRYANDTRYHMTRGPASVSDLRFTSSMAKSLINAAVELGLPDQDLNGVGQGDGFMETQITAENGHRWSTDMFLNNKQNVKILTHAFVEKILLYKGFEAYGVRYIKHGKKYTVQARRTVVLSAGTIGSPHLLMVSGIGPRQHLEQHKIKVLVDLPVGENLKDHVATGLDLVTLNQSTPLAAATILNPLNAYNYFMKGSGPLTFPGCEVVGTAYSSSVRNKSVSPPDLQIMALPGGLSSDAGVVLMKAMGISHKLWKEYFVNLVGTSVATFLPTILHPKSSGYVHLSSKRITDPPVINPQYLSHPDDVETLIKGVQLLIQLANTTAMKHIRSSVYQQPLPGCENYEFGSKRYWECYVRHLTITAYHPVGTCKMGSSEDRTTVVDHYLRVHSTSRLHVVDASIMPTLPSANINAAVMMIAEKGADVIKAHWHLQNLQRCSVVEVFINVDRQIQC